MVKVVDQVTPPRRKRFNKNKKKAWRKKTDITEVEERLEDKRREERYGGPLEERKDSEMMFVDLGDGEGEADQTETGGEEFTLEYTVDEVPGDASKVKLKPRKVKVKTAKLKSHEFINGLPGAKPPRKPRKGQGTLTVSMKKKKELQSKDPRLIKKRKEAMSQIIQDYQKATKRPKAVIKANYNTDLWAEGADEVTQECKKKGLEESFISGISDYYRRERRMKPVKVPKVRHTPTSKLDAVTVPHSGASYNPSYENHQKLLLRAVKQEEKRLKKEEKVEKATTKMFPTIDKAPTEASWLAEMSEGLPKIDDDDEEDNDDDEEEEQEEEEEQKEEEEEETEEVKEGEKAEEATEDQDKENKETLPKQEEAEKSEEDSSQQEKAEQSEEKTVMKQENKEKVSSDKVTVSSKPQTERKTKKVRRKEKRLKLEQLRKQKEKEQRIRSSNIFKLKTYQKEITQEKLLAEKRTASRRARKEKLKSMPRRLANMKFEEEDLAVSLGDELPDSLRTLTPAVELLEERFKNLQRRNILEPRQKHKLKRKYKPKVVLKRGHREELAKMEKMDFSD